ncbi:cupin domain-containing protein [Micromonospora echinospora]|uniref:cupin domain-containing protein n=1 Tax=Micromonospora echinospora TaxID=1877 RepID=UPI0037A097FA
MQTTSLTELAEQHLTAARDTPRGRSVQAVRGGPGVVLRQTLIALAGGQRLDEHENPGEATVQVLRGHVRLVAGAESCDARAGDLLVVPDARHSLEALEDSAVLLTAVTAG